MLSSKESQAVRLNSFANYCTCRGAKQLIEAKETDLHARYCPQFQEYKDWIEALPPKGLLCLVIRKLETKNALLERVAYWAKKYLSNDWWRDELIQALDALPENKDQG